MRQKPVISIITPAFNAERFIEEAIESVLAQTFTDWEMIIVDDCSEDRTVEIVQQYQRKDDRIKLIKLEKNSGSAVARNTAMDHALGRYLAFLDSDDVWMKEKLATQLRFMQEKDLAFSFTSYLRMKEDGTDTSAIVKAPKRVDYDDLMKQCVIGCLTVMLDREKIGPLKMPNMRTRQDYAYWLKITRKGHKAYGIPEVLAKYRLVQDSISSNKLKAARKNWQLYRHIEKHSFFKAAWYFSNYAIRSVLSIIKYKFFKTKN